jgi:hypothetical protein
MRGSAAAEDDAKPDGGAGHKKYFTQMIEAMSLPKA